MKTRNPERKPLKARTSPRRVSLFSLAQERSPEDSMGRYNLITTPEKVVQGYADGSIKGSLRDPAGLEQFLAESRAPIFEAAAWELTGSGAGKTVLSFKAAQKYHDTFGYNEAQTTGDCVSHATRNAGFIDHCVDAMEGVVSYAGNIFATENIYGWRGHGGQGASCSRLAGYVSAEGGVGGFLPRSKYEAEGSRDSVDLSVYNSRIGHNWGPRGTPDWLNDIADEHAAHYVSLVMTLEGARDAIANGYALSACSNLGFSNRRNALGIAERQGSWAHAMAWVAVIDDPEDPAYKETGGMLFLIQNSWGKWNSGGKHHDQPDGSFWVTWRVAQAILNARGTYAIGRTKFRKRKLDYMLI